MVDFDALTGIAGYRNIDVTQEHAPRKERGGSQLSWDENKKKEHLRAEKKRVGWVQISQDPNKKKEHT